MKVYISVTDGVHCWYGIDQPNVGRPVLGIISLEGSTGRNFNITICVSVSPRSNKVGINDDTFEQYDIVQNITLI